MSKKTERTERATVGSSIECDEGCSADKKKIKKRKPAALTIDKSKKVKENIVSVAKTVSHEENLNSKSESSIENEEYEKETQDFDDLSDSKDVSSPIPPEEPSIGSPNNNEQGEFRVDAKEWVWDFAKDCRLRVGMFRNKRFVDIRHLWQGHPTKKGVFLPVEAFLALQKWPKLEEALKLVQKSYS